MGVARMRTDNGARRYHYLQGKIIFVSCGISNGTTWMTVSQKPGCDGTHRVKSKFLPLRDSREKAQADLDRWARERGLGEVGTDA